MSVKKARAGGKECPVRSERGWFLDGKARGANDEGSALCLLWKQSRQGIQGGICPLGRRAELHATLENGRQQVPRGLASEGIKRSFSPSEFLDGAKKGADEPPTLAVAWQKWICFLLVLSPSKYHPFWTNCQVFGGRP